ncbi:MAG: XdhC family protein [Bacteroidota bacterium]
MLSDFLKNANTLLAARQPYAMAMVVNRMIPSSGKPGDKAIIKKDGSLEGWVGGGCTRGIIIKEAMAAMEDGTPRVVRISPDDDQQPRAGIMDYKMTCHSGGTVEVYIEPVLPRPQIIIIGKSAIAGALVRLAKAMDYHVTVMARGIDAAAFAEANTIMDTIDFSEIDLSYKSYVIVATQGEGDEEGMEQAMAQQPGYLAFIASRKKANHVYQYLREKGISFDQLKQVKTPAGLDINAKLPEEIALSILAEIVQTMRSKKADATPQPAASNNTDTAAMAEEWFVNPVCGVPVSKSNPKHIVEHEGTAVYFCCDGCKVTFEKSPDSYIAKMKAG